MRWPKKFNAWLSTHDQFLNSWASIITIISFPSIFIGLIIGYYEIKGLLVQPTVELELVYPTEVSYKLLNRSEKIAEDVLISFGIFDLDSNSEIIKQAKLPNPLPIRSEQIDYVNANSAKGPWSLLDKFAKTGHRYFGFVFVGCRGCNNLERYWIYIKHGDGNESFYARRSRADTFEINFARLYFETSSYLNELIPPKRRLPILYR